MNIYQTLYDLINTHIFQSTIIEGSYQDLVTTFFSTTFSFLLIAVPVVIPFMVILAIFKSIDRW